MKLLMILWMMVLVLGAKEINIAVAANVSYAIDELKAEFAKIHPEIHVNVTLGGSGKLTAQIKHGAPYGLFMSANMDYPNALYRDKVAITKPMVYAQGALAYFSVKERDFSKGVALLKSNDIRKIAIANPKTAPYGKAAMQALKNAKIYDDIRSKFVYGESISQTVSYTMTAADIGIIATSSLYSSKMVHYKRDTNWKNVDATLYTPIQQGIVLLKQSHNDGEYRAFYEFILSKKARRIFKKYGYIV